LPTEERIKKIRDAVSKRQKDIVLVLEDLTDPHNIEATFRSCDAFGIQNVYIIFETQEKFNPQKIGKSSSSSANKWLDFKIFDSTSECMKDLKNDGYKIYGTTLESDSVGISEIDFDCKVALVIGNESRGITEEVKKSMDIGVKIPMNGMVQSFNVSVATAIFLYEASRQRSENGSKHQYSPAEMEKKVSEFLER